MAFRRSRDATDYGQRPVTCNTCNNGGFLRVLPLQAGGDFRKTGCNFAWEGESHAFASFFRSFRDVGGMDEMEKKAEWPPSGPDGALLIVHPA